jgi:ADP-ribose pyrophosphatase YjhB (NUDIX family)
VSEAAMKFCSVCGSGAMVFRVPEGDTLPRFVCPDCGTVHYQNPKIVVGSLPVWHDQVLLCRRAIGPRLGYWTLPAGFLENDESLEAGALRETEEEAHAHIDALELYTVISVLHVNQVHVIFRAHLVDTNFSAGTESLEVRLFREEEIPWESIAFRTIARSLRNFFSDRLVGAWPLHVSSIDRRNK